jgi:DNA ligase-1
MIKQILDEIAALSGKNDKRACLAKYADNELLKEVIYKAHSPRVKYYIKQIPEYTSAPLTDDSYTLPQMLTKIEAFSSREMTGNIAINYLTAMLTNSHPDDAYVIEKVIGKNLKIGMDSGYNDVIPDLIEETPYMGAKSYSEKLVKKLFASGKGVRSDIKADGTYRNAIIRSGEVELLSRQGEVSVLSGAPFLNELTAMDDCVLNGELTIDGEPSRTIANGMVSSIMDILQKAEDRGEKVTNKKKILFEEKHGSFEGAIQNMRFTVWDMITIEEYFDKKSSRPYEERREALAVALPEGITMVGMVESRIVTTFAEAMAHFQDALERGLEGTILKAMDGGWKDGKPTYQVKMKLDISIDFKITGFLYGNEGTKNENVISRLQVESSCGLLKTQPSGMKEKMMRMITDNQEDLMGTIVEVRCSGLSHDSDGNWSCMHPSVVELRSDKNTYDSLESAQEIEEMAKTLG